MRVGSSQRSPHRNGSVAPQRNLEAGGPHRPPGPSGLLDEPNPKERRLILEADHLVILHPDGPAGGYPMAVRVDRVDKGLHWFLGCCDPIGRGESMIVESPIHDDARYVTRATVEACSPQTFALKLKPVWERVQQRAFVRIYAHGLQVRVLRLPPLGSEPAAASDPSIPQTSEETPEVQDSIYDLVDISAGGIRFRTEDDFEADEEVVCHFELPGSLCFVLPARIRRSAGAQSLKIHKSTVAVEFQGLDENNRSQLLHWVYREQVKRHREGVQKGPWG